MTDKNDEIGQIVDRQNRKIGDGSRALMRTGGLTHRASDTTLRQAPPGDTFFLHGLDSSGQGTKGRFFAEHFPHIYCPTFTGTLAERLHQLTGLCQGRSNLTLIGSSFGGLMATCFAQNNRAMVSRLILLAPALNYGEYRPPAQKLVVPTTLIIGKGDTVTPPALVIPLARQSFADIIVSEEDDDHMLLKTFVAMPWHQLLMT